MKDLIKAALFEGGAGIWGVTALILFFGVMVGVSIWILRPGSKQYYQYVAKQALKGEKQ